MSHAHSKKIFAVCDLEEAYVARLVSYLKESRQLPFEILAFTSLSSLIEYSGSHSIEILLISTTAMCDQVRLLDVGRIIILNEGEDPDLAGEPVLSKYQPAPQLEREVLAVWQGNSLPAGTLAESGVSVYAVSSPIGRCGKTLFALTLGEILAENGRTLYLNMENCSGFETLLGRSYRCDMTDLLTLCGQGDGRFCMKTESCLQTIGNLEYIPPAFFPEDLKSIAADQWLTFLGELSTALSLQNLVLDLGNGLPDVPELLRHVQHIYMPVLPDPVSRAKISQYEKNLEALSLRDVQERTVRLYLPEIDIRGGGDQLTDSLVNGRMGEFVRSLLAEQANSRHSMTDPDLPGI